MDVAAFLLALVPIIWLVVMLLCFKWPAWKAAIGSFVLSCLLAFAWWHLPAAQIATFSTACLSKYSDRPSSGPMRRALLNACAAA